MALVVKDRVQETSSTTGTGTLTLSGAATGYQSFSSAIGNGNTTYYAVYNGADWEVGVGTVGAGTLSRDTVLESSNAGSLVDFAVGVKTVFCTYPAERSVNTEDIGVSIQAYDADTAKYDDTTANFVGTLQNGGSNVLVDTDIGSTVEAYDSTILKSASIGVTVQGYDADTAKYDDVTANFTGTLQNGGSNVLVDTDIGSTVQGYDADTAKYDDTTANFTGTLQNGGSNVVVDTDIGSTVQAYDADTTKNDVSNTFTANQIISVTDNTNAALRVTQAGTGDAFLVEDEANPDSTPFVVKNDGKVGIGTSSPANALDVVASEPFVKVSTSSSGLSAFYQATNPQGSFYAGKDRDGSAGLFGSAGEYVIAGSGNYPMDFWTNTVKRMSITGAGLIGIGTASPSVSLDIGSKTDAIKIPSGTTAERPASPASGMVRYNTTESKYEVYNGSSWSYINITGYPYTSSYLIVAAGGGGGFDRAGGAGAGGVLSGTSSLSPGTTYTITVGAGGTRGASGVPSTNGNNSVFNSLTAIGGGAGATSNPAASAISGGSGGGGYGQALNPPTITGASGTSGQGNAGGNGTNGSPFNSGGGGGAGSVGGNAGTNGGNGGSGIASSITGSSLNYAGGGGGGVNSGTGGTASSGGGAGGNSGVAGGNGTANTGGGGGGGGGALSNGGTGGSGVVILSVPTTNYSGITTGSPTVTTSGSNTIIKFTSSGSYTA